LRREKRELERSRQEEGRQGSGRRESVMEGDKKKKQERERIATNKHLEQVGRHWSFKRVRTKARSMPSEPFTEMPASPLFVPK